MSDTQQKREAKRTKFADSIERETGINEQVIRRLVHAFYGRVRSDDVLAPIFESRIRDWKPHLERMCAFWSSVALMTGRYHGRPMPAHAPLPIGADHFDRWLSLFSETAIEVCTPAGADLLIGKAHMIASSLQMGIAVHRGQILQPGDRLQAPQTTAGT